jgi:hypothetical protein
MPHKPDDPGIESSGGGEIDAAAGINLIAGLVAGPADVQTAAASGGFR